MSYLLLPLFLLFSMATGEGAEELVEDMPKHWKKIIHEHEELAEKLALVLYATGILVYCRYIPLKEQIC
jgi:hypothetical protein